MKQTKTAWFRSFYMSMLSVVGFAALTVLCGAMIKNVFSDEAVTSRALAGDANCDGDVSLPDAVLTVRATAGRSALTVQGKMNADVDKNSVVDSNDLQHILRHLVDSGYSLDPLGPRHTTETTTTETTTSETTTTTTESSTTETTTDTSTSSSETATSTTVSQTTTTTTSETTATSQQTSETTVSSDTEPPQTVTGDDEHLIVSDRLMPLGLGSGDLIAKLGSPTEEIVQGYEACDMKFFIYNEKPEELHIAIVANDTVVGYYAVGSYYVAPEGYKTVEYVDKQSGGSGNIFAVFAMKDGYTIDMNKIRDKSDLSIMAKLNWYGVNALRALNGLKPLNWNSVLVDVAKEHSRDMADNNFFAHEGSDGSTSKQRIMDSGLKNNARGENIDCGYTDPFKALYGWYTSETGHRDIMMAEIFTDIGISFAYNADSTYKFYGTQDYASVTG